MAAGIRSSIPLMSRVIARPPISHGHSAMRAAIISDLLEINAPASNNALSSYVKVRLPIRESHKIPRYFPGYGHFFT
jgi:hypothetical protein